MSKIFRDIQTLPHLNRGKAKPTDAENQKIISQMKGLLDFVTEQSERSDIGKTKEDYQAARTKLLHEIRRELEYITAVSGKVLKGAEEKKVELDHQIEALDKKAGSLDELLKKTKDELKEQKQGFASFRQESKENEHKLNQRAEVLEKNMESLEAELGNSQLQIKKSREENRKILADANRKEEDLVYGDKIIRVFTYELKGRIIWGATAWILSQFLEILRKLSGAHRRS
ncbi:MAG: hypothetical protein E4H40_06890 [Candidatus Brocadiia bacterium]|nr:MAG: hypothetical protein E4H40_06890 [Candidatus Brocadiia bacterium]